MLDFCRVLNNMKVLESSISFYNSIIASGSTCEALSYEHFNIDHHLHLILGTVYAIWIVAVLQ